MSLSLCVFQRPHYYCREFCANFFKNVLTCATCYPFSSYFYCGTDLFGTRSYSSIFSGAWGHPSTILNDNARDCSPRGLVVALLRDHLTRRDVQFAEPRKTLIACKNRVLQLETSLSTAALTGLTIRSRSTYLQTGLKNMRVGLRTARSSTTTDISELSQLLIDKNRLRSCVSGLTCKLDDMRHRPATVQSFIFSADLESL